MATIQNIVELIAKLTDKSDTTHAALSSFIRVRDLITTVEIRISQESSPEMIQEAIDHLGDVLHILNRKRDDRHFLNSATTLYRNSIGRDVVKEIANTGKILRGIDEVFGIGWDDIKVRISDVIDILTLVRNHFDGMDRERLYSNWADMDTAARDAVPQSLLDVFLSKEE